MILLVDSYNIIRFLYPGGKHAHEAQVAWFLRQLSLYKKAKCSEVGEVLAVFDGGLFSRKLREIIGGVVVVYAGTGRKADDVLADYAASYRERALLVTNDRELQRRALASRCTSLDVSTFWSMVEEVCARHKKDVAAVQEYGELVITKYVVESEATDDEMLCGDEVDSLMVAASVQHDKAFAKKEDRAPQVRISQDMVSKKNRLTQLIRKKLG